MFCNISKAKEELRSQQATHMVSSLTAASFLYTTRYLNIHKNIYAFTLPFHPTHFLGFGGCLTPMLSVLYVDIFMYVKIAFLPVTKMTNQMPGICSDTVSDIRTHIHTPFFCWSAAADRHFSAEPNAGTYHMAAQKRLVPFQTMQISCTGRLHMAP